MESRGERIAPVAAEDIGLALATALPALLPLVSRWFRVSSSGGRGNGGSGMVVPPIPTPLTWSFDHTRRIIHVSLVMSPHQRQ